MTQTSTGPTESSGVEHMKWWGWGLEDVSFHHEDKPALAPFVRKVIDLDLDAHPTPVSDFTSLQVPESRCTDDLAELLTSAVGAEHVHTDGYERVLHAYGKSLRDLVRVRAGELPRVPDVVVYPGSEEDVTAVMTAALAVDAVVIPFGGGTNISGSLEADPSEQRPIVSVDMGRMNRVLDIDPDSQLARVQPGVLGPDLEEQLGAAGWTLGHYPDSFTHSTLGGWIATRSSGMQSDKYGDISEITRAVRVVTPDGTLVTRAVPSTSTGPSVREMVLGSEGRLGIITEATVQVHRLPAKRVVLAYFFRDWDSALDAMREIAASDAAVSITRVSDANETAFSFATRKAGGGVSSLVSKGLMEVLKRRGWHLDQICLSFIGYEGSDSYVLRNRRMVGRIVSRHGGIGVGSGPGTLYDQKKFDTPYIRDYLLDRGALADVSETAAKWSQLLPLYRHVTSQANDTFARLGVKGFIMCHLSHSYHSGACLYFTFAFRPAAGSPPIEQYDQVKSAVQQGFLDSGGTLSHHHAVGLEHARWMPEDISEPGVAMLAGLFAAVDPGRNLNPGKVVPATD